MRAAMRARRAGARYARGRYAPDLVPAGKHREADVGTLPLRSLMKPGASEAHLSTRLVGIVGVGVGVGVAAAAVLVN